MTGLQTSTADGDERATQLKLKREPEPMGWQRKARQWAGSGMLPRGQELQLGGPPGSGTKEQPTALKISESWEDTT